MATSRLRASLIAAASAALLLVAVACDPNTDLGGNPAPAVPAKATKLLTVIVENHSLVQMSQQMPYLFGLAQQFAYASNYKAITHPSLPNYLSLAGGSTFEVKNDAGPSWHRISGPSVFDRALASGHTARVYAEGMKSNCAAAPAGRYAVKHNPWVYFTDGQSACAAHDVPAGTPAAGALHDDITNAALPNAGMLIPDMCNDGHDCPLATADLFLKSWLDPILAGPDFSSGELVVVVTADEDDSAHDNQVLTVVLSKSLDGAHLVVTTPLNHFSVTRLYGQVTKSALVGVANIAPDMVTAFGL